MVLRRLVQHDDNSVFGKTMYHKQNIELKLSTATNSSTQYPYMAVNTSRYIDGLPMIDMYSRCVVYDKPVCV